MNKKNYLKHPLSLLILLLLPLACTKNNSGSKSPTSTKSFPNKETEFHQEAYPSYAKLFSAEYKKDYKIITVKNSFDTSQVEERYILLPKGEPQPKNLPRGTKVNIPLESIGVAYATHIGYLEKMGLLHTINGVSQKKYIKNEKIRQLVDEGTIKTFGPSHSINVEKLLSINPPLLLVAPFKDNRYNRVKEVGIKIAVNASYMETSPLARAEWIKFISYFFNKEKEANRIFDSLSQQYNRLKHLTDQREDTPTIFSGKKIGQIWYVPGGESYMAKFFKDAGANYLWSENKKSGSLPLDFESVFYKARKADFWCIKENYQGRYTYNDLRSEFIHYNEFEAFKDHRILFCNTHTKPYFEKGVLEPQVILADLIHFLHPELLPDHKNKYYEYLNTEK